MSYLGFCNIYKWENDDFWCCYKVMKISLKCWNVVYKLFRNVEMKFWNSGIAYVS